ncbi:1-acyl-sn-glycerol-3-phosphate acyltransferase [Bacteroidales bacterium OttesenSCG-928-A17]|nr:1-acyl-sn-glycerol-3-phosphate acyltransferase [Bacteroidales bacterium OttesenSCG-928-A17]
MIRNREFDDIRPFYDEEVQGVVEELIADERFKSMVQSVFPNKDWTELTNLMRSLRTRKDFLYKVSWGIVSEIVSQSSQGVKSSGYENIEKTGAYTFMSNHRDIILDAAILSVLLADHGFIIPKIAIGDNLLLQPWIENLVRVNGSFIVKRGVSMRQMLDTSLHLSRYIHYTIQEKKQSLWIAQREGRAKDSDDRTQESLLKMLGMGGKKDSFVDDIRRLNICPVSLSYEYDPCDYLKAKEFQQKRDNPEYKKSQSDDLLSMEIGLFGFKGNIHFQIGKPINTLFKSGDFPDDKSEQITSIAKLIDEEIFRNYKFYPVNYIAYDRMTNTKKFEDQYTEADIQFFDVYLRQQISKIDLPEKDIPFLTEKMVEMYSNPVKNFLSIANK